MKNFITTFRFPLLVIIVLMTLSSCKTTKILSATFENDVIGQPPAKDLAGAPSGDKISFVPELAPQLKVQASVTAGQKALHLIDVPVQVIAHNRWVGFRSISTNLAETLWFSYAAKNNNASGNVLIDVSDGAGHLIARMRIHSNGDVRLAKNLTDDYTDNIGNVGDRSHTVMFTVSPSTLKYNVTVFQTGGSSFAAENRPMITTNALEFANPANPAISFSHGTDVGGNHQYIIESVTISRKKPD